MLLVFLLLLLLLLLLFEVAGWIVITCFFFPFKRLSPGLYGGHTDRDPEGSGRGLGPVRTADDACYW
jgi:hypothetical protein